ncbi:MAG: glycoside hydrolase family 1 protein [Candidatus Omnitrophica bacterium]|nr:glycoside hydrolase family 1 protein [Candidatus Omnitrophota bacterium]
MSESSTDKKFPQGFLWGAATSSHQIEGDNKLSDWWQWELDGRTTDKSGAACDSYHRYPEDFEIAKSMGHNAHRFSIEWSRVQPEEGRWDEDALRHYQGVIRSLKERGLEPMVTLHHFTLPVWLSRAGGFEHPKFPEYFEAYTRVMVRALGPDIRFWITFNELNVMTYKGYLEGEWPPGKRSVRSAWRAATQLVRAAYRAYSAIHEEYKKYAWPVCRVGVAQHLLCVDPSNPASAADRRAASMRAFYNNDLFLRLLMGKPDDWLVILAGCSGKGRAMDFIGVNYYMREHVRASAKGLWWEKYIGEVDRKHPDYLQGDKNELGWAIYPEGLKRVMLDAHKKYGLPMAVTENGICTRDEAQRSRFILDHLTALHAAIGEGAEVLGFFYWSLLDNFEWSIGYMPKFGLVAVDPQTQVRTPKSSVPAYAQVCRSNQL